MKFAIYAAALLPVVGALTGGYLSQIADQQQTQHGGGYLSQVATQQTQQGGRTYVPGGKAFFPQTVAQASQQQVVIDLQETAQRDVTTLRQWAQQYGVQIAPGFEITTQDGYDYSVITNHYIPAGTQFLVVPSTLVLSSGEIAQELGGNLVATENALLALDDATGERVPLFRLMVKILTELEAGYESPYYAWLNSLPRLFYNGVAMTDACFDCLPPYASYLSLEERQNFSRFLTAVKYGYLELSQATLEDDSLIQWAYNVALTRHQQVSLNVPQQDGRVLEKKVAPIADMLNHAAEPNANIDYDYQGNCVVTATQDIQAGSPITISLGDPTNPTPLFAKYGFLYDDCPTIFCKALHLQNEIQTLGYEFSELLFHTETGAISPKVWDIFLLNVLQNNSPGEAQTFSTACIRDDEYTKQTYHKQYYAYVLDALKEFINNMIQDVDEHTMRANSYNLNEHPRVPVIVAHNTLVQTTFRKVQEQLYTMG